ncbi:MAG: zinc ABC transporter substrate-binding protein [Prolixibacteraceae bacterium]|nr:zinc ABC transporter substrate-binding protein [Prolixibacteraceae bacterium]
MNKFFILLIFPILALACSTGKKQDEKPVITVSILPQKYFVEQVAGDEFSINVMLPPGASPADFEPTPKQIHDLNNSVIYFYVGHLGFEKSWMSKFSETARNVSYVSCSRGIDLLRSTHECQAEDSSHVHLHKDGTDPHIWTSPENVKTIARTICSSLSEMYPGKKGMFEKNRDTFIEKIYILDNHIRDSFEGKQDAAFLIFHPALGYYARDYHLKQYSIEYEGKPPSTAQMKALVDLAVKENISTIFIQSQFETSKAKTIAKEIGARVISVDPLAENWLTEMYSLTEKMNKAFTAK